MAYGRLPNGRTSLDNMNRRLRRENHVGYEPKGPWWQKVLATVIVIAVIVAVLALATGGDIFKIFTEINWL